MAALPFVRLAAVLRRTPIRLTGMYTSLCIYPLGLYSGVVVDVLRAIISVYVTLLSAVCASSRVLSIYTLMWTLIHSVRVCLCVNILSIYDSTMIRYRHVLL